MPRLNNGLPAALRVRSEEVMALDLSVVRGRPGLPGSDNGLPAAFCVRSVEVVALSPVHGRPCILSARQDPCEPIPSPGPVRCACFSLRTPLNNSSRCTSFSTCGKFASVVQTGDGTRKKATSSVIEQGLPTVGGGAAPLRFQRQAVRAHVSCAEHPSVDALVLGTDDAGDK